MTGFFTGRNIFRAIMFYNVVTIGLRLRTKQRPPLRRTRATAAEVKTRRWSSRGKRDNVPSTGIPRRAPSLARLCGRPRCPCDPVVLARVRFRGLCLPAGPRGCTAFAGAGAQAPCSRAAQLAHGACRCACVCVCPAAACAPSPAFSRAGPLCRRGTLCASQAGMLRTACLAAICVGASGFMGGAPAAFMGGRAQLPAATGRAAARGACRYAALPLHVPGPLAAA